MKDDSGNVVYGSITEETKVALEKVAGLYADGLIDPEILVRNDSSEPLLAGKVGIFFVPGGADIQLAMQFWHRK